MSRYGGFLVCALVALVVAGCETVPSARVHYTLKHNPSARPLEQVVVMPVEVNVFEMSAGGIKEEVPAWSDTAENNVRSALMNTQSVDCECCAASLLEATTLTPEEQAILEEHVAMFEQVAVNALWLMFPENTTAWKFKNERFDYTLGDGLGFLKRRYGLDGGLFVLGEDVVSTAGRKVTALVAAAFGVVVPMGHSFLVVGLVDFDTGDLLWLDHEISPGEEDLRDMQSCRRLVTRLMQDYPGLQARGVRRSSAVR